MNLCEQCQFQNFTRPVNCFNLLVEMWRIYVPNLNDNPESNSVNTDHFACMVKVKNLIILVIYCIWYCLIRHLSKNCMRRDAVHRTRCPFLLLERDTFNTYFRLERVEMN